MKKNLREQYLKQANSLCSRLLGEAPEDEATPETNDVGTEDQENTNDTDTDAAQVEKGQSEQIDIFFDNLDEETQKVLLDALKENLNIAEDDDFANQKIIDTLAKEPLVSLRAEELVRKLNIDI